VSEQFEDLVLEAMRGLPEEFASKLENVEIVIEDEPTAEQIARLSPGSTLFGLYEGVPQTKRGNFYSGVLPDKITIFRGPISRAYADPPALREQVRKTVIHEIAHHFGISDERLRELGW